MGTDADIVQTLIDIQHRLCRAWTTRDRATVESIIAPDWTSTGVDGRIVTRAEVVGDVFESGIHQISTLDMDDIRVRVLGDTAVVTGRTHGAGRYGATPFDVTIRFTDVFVLRDGRWQAVASHASVVPPAASGDS